MGLSGYGWQPRNPSYHVQVSSPIALAIEGFKFARRMPNGLYQGQELKRGASHKVVAKWPKPHLASDAPPGVFRVVYADPKNYTDFIGANAEQLANEKLAQLRALARTAAPYSAVTIPLGKRYKEFSRTRAEMAADGSLYVADEPRRGGPTTTQPADTTMAKKPAKKPAKKNTAPKAPKAPRDEKNGQVRPKEGSTTRKTWDIADKLSEKAGKPAERADVLEAATKAGVNPATAATQYGRWRVYNGLKGRSAKPKAPKKTAAKGTKGGKGKPAKKGPPPPPPPAPAAAQA